MQTMATPEKSKSSSSAAFQKTKHQPFFAPVHVQPKLTVGAADDPYEHEADEVADHIVRNLSMYNNSAKHGSGKPAFFGPDYSSTLNQSPQSKSAAQKQVNRQVKRQDEEKKIQRKSNGISNPGTEAPSAIHEVISSGGQPLPYQTRSLFEPLFGYDFTNVKIHTDQQAAATADSIQANAYTTGNNVVFNSDKYDPGSESGIRLLAHELTHVVQQGQKIPVNFIQRDLAVEPANPEAIARELSETEIQEAIRYNRNKFRNEEEIRNLRDVLGLSDETADIDEEFVRTVAQWQAENNLTQDGKIGPGTARIIGTEMLEETRTVSSQRRPAIQMLERGIVLSFSHNTYNDTATTSSKNIHFNVYIPQGLNMRDYALVNFLSGELLFMPGPTHPTVTMYGSNVPFNFPATQVDSVDTDPIYWSDAANRWNYNISGRTFTATDDPGRPDHTFNLGDSANVNFRIGVFRISDLPLTTTGNVGTAQPIVSAAWRFSVLRDPVSGVITHP